MALHMDFGLSPFLTASPAFDLLTGLMDEHPFTRDVPYHFRRADVVETKDGYLISAHLPGVSADEVSVSVEASSDSTSRLALRAGAHLTEGYSLPSHLVEVSQTRASMIDGVLRVVVPKKAAVEIPITVGDANTLSVEDDSNVKIYKLEAPGFSAKDIAATVKMPDHRLIVEGDAEHEHGTFQHSIPLPALMNADTAVENLSVNIINGLLTVRVVNPTSSTPVVIPVLNEMPVTPAATNTTADTDNTTGTLTLMEKAVPGLGAGDFQAEVTADRKVQIVENVKHADGSANSRKRCRRHFSFQTRLPAGVDDASVKVFCINGLLTVIADKPTESSRNIIEVSATELACINNSDGDELMES